MTDLGAPARVGQAEEELEELCKTMAADRAPHDADVQPRSGAREAVAYAVKKKRDDLHGPPLQGVSQAANNGMAIFPREEKASVTARERQVPLRTVTWNLAGLAENSLEPFLACARVTMLRSVVFLQETYRKRFSLLLELFQGITMAVRDDRPSVCRIEFVTSAISWKVATDGWQILLRTPKRVLIGAHLPTIKAPLEDYNVPLHEVEQSVRKLPGHRFSRRSGTWGQTPSQQQSLLQRNRRELRLSHTFWRAQVSFLQTRGDE